MLKKLSFIIGIFTLFGATLWAEPPQQVSQFYPRSRYVSPPASPYHQAGRTAPAHSRARTQSPYHASPSGHSRPILATRPQSNLQQRACSLVQNAQQLAQTYQSLGFVLANPVTFQNGTSHFVSGLLQDQARLGNSREVVRALLYSLNKLGNQDRGQLLSTLALAARYLPQNDPLKNNVAQAVWTGLNALNNPNTVRAYLAGRTDKEIQKFQSALVGFAARASEAGREEWQRVTGIPAYEVGELIANHAPRDVARNLMQRYLRQMLARQTQIDPKFVGLLQKVSHREDLAPVAQQALQQLAGRYLNRDSVRRILRNPTVQDGYVLLTASRQDQQRLVRAYLQGLLAQHANISPEMLMLFQTFAASPDNTLKQLAFSALNHYGISPRGQKTVQNVINRFQGNFRTREQRAVQDLNSINNDIATLLTDLAQLGLEIGEVAGGPGVGNICAAANACIYAIRGQRWEAAVAAIGILPFVGDLARLTRAGSAVRRLISLAMRFERGLYRLARIKRQADRIVGMVGVARNAAVNFQNNRPIVPHALYDLGQLSLQQAYMARLGPIQTIFNPDAPTNRLLSQALLQPGRVFDDGTNCQQNPGPIRRVLNFISTSLSETGNWVSERLTLPGQPLRTLFRRTGILPQNRALLTESIPAAIARFYSLTPQQRQAFFQQLQNWGNGHIPPQYIHAAALRIAAHANTQLRRR